MNFLLFLVFVVVIWVLWHDSGKDAPFVPTDPDVVSRIMKLARVSEEDVFYDLGSGDGRFVIAAGLKGARAVGVEKNRFKVFYSRLWVKLLRLDKKVKILNEDIFEVDLSEATVVCLYLLQETNNKIQKKLENELKPGTRVVSVAFKFKDWTPENTDKRGVLFGPIRIYKIDKR